MKMWKGHIRAVEMVEAGTLLPQVIYLCSLNARCGICIAANAVMLQLGSSIGIPQLEVRSAIHESKCLRAGQFSLTGVNAEQILM
jgi:hypothetical protein